MIALFRYYNIPLRLKANPMKNDFMRPAMGAAYLTVSSPFYHCFTEAYLDGRWIAIDPTLDKNTYNTFFLPKMWIGESTGTAPIICNCIPSPLWDLPNHIRILIRH
jgi:transglutaminase-like putative cysteine protease